MQNIVPRYVDLIWHVFLPYRPLSTITSNCGSVQCADKRIFQPDDNYFFRINIFVFWSKIWTTWYLNRNNDKTTYDFFFSKRKNETRQHESRMFRYFSCHVRSQSCIANKYNVMCQLDLSF
jgi:hypothetical protein